MRGIGRWNLIVKRTGSTFLYFDGFVEVPMGPGWKNFQRLGQAGKRVFTGTMYKRQQTGRAFPTYSD